MDFALFLDFTTITKNMKTSWKTPFTSTLLFASIISASQAAVIGFSEDFTATTLNTAWNESGTGGSFDAANDIYSLSHTNGSPAPRLQRNEGGTIGSFTSTITVNLAIFSNPSVGADFKWKFFGPDGFTEIVLNSFGDMRMFHNDFAGGAGNIQQNTNIGLTGAGDLLELTLQYDDVADQLEVTYSLNGGGSTPFYSGGGIDGRVGDLVTNFTQVEVFEFGGGAPVPVVQVQEWNLTPVTSIPEPSSSLLLAGCLGLFAIRRRR